MKAEDVNKMIIDYSVTTTKQVVEFNQKLFADYVAFTQSLAAMVPGLDKILPFGLKK